MWLSVWVAALVAIERRAHEERVEHRARHPREQLQPHADRAAGERLAPAVDVQLEPLGQQVQQERRDAQRDQHRRPAQDDLHRGEQGDRGQRAECIAAEDRPRTFRFTKEVAGKKLGLPEP